MDSTVGALPRHSAWSTRHNSTQFDPVFLASSSEVAEELLEVIAQSNTFDSFSVLMDGVIKVEVNGG